MNPTIYPASWLDRDGVEYGITEHDGIVYVIGRHGSGHRVTDSIPWIGPGGTEVTEARLRGWLNGTRALSQRGVPTGAVALGDWITSVWGRARWRDLITGSRPETLTPDEQAVVAHLRKQVHQSSRCALCLSQSVIAGR